jgi:ssRNA-specific RNase YbeY (16S rRNA maturation enzyme)
MADNEFCTIINTTKGKLPRLPFVSIKEAILGKKYDLSVSFISPKKQKEINKTYRNINKTTNVLSFPNSKTSGEITFDLVKVRQDAPLFDMPYTKFLKFLFINQF